MIRTLHWFREDLRVEDNTALYYAAERAQDGCLAVYLLTPQTALEHDMAACRMDFILRGLVSLKKDLTALNIPLIVLDCESFNNIPDILLKLCQRYHLNAVYFNQQYEVNEKSRDQKVISLLTSSHIQVHSHVDQTILPPDLTRTQKGEPFSVFTPFRKAWLAGYQQQARGLLPRPQRQQQLIQLETETPIPAVIKGFESAIAADVWPAGEASAHNKLDHFVDRILPFYQKKRDFPAQEGTSQLSPYLAAGMISPRQCLKAAIEFNQGRLEGHDENASTWINELIWREFYKSILVHFPRVCRHRPFKLITEKIKWDENEAYLTAWKKGQTGFPLVDAAMRQLQQLGWMHNRLRMVVAMFFSKQLWLDWRVGEQFFMRHLMDGDLASNNGGWQWSASTGNDAAPYFRIFNPITQSERFDPSGEFIRRYCPELKDLKDRAIHNPYASADLFSRQLNYPHPIVDYKKTRERAIAAFKAL